jgi:ubiquinone biosynthesis protein COQ9
MEAMTDQTADPADWADAKEQAVLDAALAIAPERGWGADLATRAGAVVGLTPAETDLLLPHGARDLAALLSRRCDAASLRALANTDPAALKVRERIRAGVIARLDAHRDYMPAARRCMGFLCLPSNLPLASRLLWESADVIWRWAGDTATDENHYSKRAILSGVLTAVLTTDLAQGREAAIAQLDARLANVMAFEKWKAGIKPLRLVEQAASALGRLRYGHN